jgi:hypothetical protein
MDTESLVYTPEGGEEGIDDEVDFGFEMEGADFGDQCAVPEDIEVKDDADFSNPVPLFSRETLDFLQGQVTIKEDGTVIPPPPLVVLGDVVESTPAPPQVFLTVPVFSTDIVLIVLIFLTEIVLTVLIFLTEIVLTVLTLLTELPPAAAPVAIPHGLSCVITGHYHYLRRHRGCQRHRDTSGGTEPLTDSGAGNH